MNIFKNSTFIIAVIIIAVWAPLYIIQISDINREKDGCERLNDVRYQLYKTLDIAKNLVPDEQLKNAFAIEQRSLENSTSKYRNEETVNPVDVDCDEAYPKPFPLNAFIDE